MRTSRILALSFVVSLMSGSAIEARAADELICRGGATMKIAVAHAVSSEGIPGRTVMTIYFKASPGPTEDPQPGECSSAGRTVQSKTLWIDSARIQFAFQVRGDGRIVNDGTPRVEVEGAGLSEEARMWQTVVAGVMQGKFFRVQVEEKPTIFIIKGASAQ